MNKKILSLAVLLALIFSPALAQQIIPGGGSGGSSGTVTSISPGSANIVTSPNPITGVGTVDIGTALSIANTVSIGTSASTGPLTVGSPGFAATAGTVLGQFTGSTNNYLQLSLQNLSSGVNASSDFVVTANDGNDSTHYADFGINNSAGATTPFTTAHAAYFYSSDSELDIGALGASGVTNLYAAGGIATPTLSLAAASTGVTIPGTLGVTGHVTFETITSTGATGTGKLVFDTSPTFTTGATTPLLTSSATTAIGYNANTVTTGNALTATGISSTTGALNIGGSSMTSAVGYLYNTTGAGMTTAKAISITGSATMTADYSGAFVSITPTRTATAAATRAESGNMLLVQPVESITGTLATINNVSGPMVNFTRTVSNTSSSASSSINLSGAVLAVSNPSPTRTNPVVDTAPVATFTQSDASATVFPVQITSAVGAIPALSVSGGIGTAGSAPTPTGTGSPTIATGSTDTAGEVTAGASATSVIITFAVAKTNAPFCTVTPQGTIVSFAYTISGSAINITQTATSGDKIDYVCVGH